MNDLTQQEISALKRVELLELALEWGSNRKWNKHRFNKRRWVTVKEIKKLKSRLLKNTVLPQKTPARLR